MYSTFLNMQTHANRCLGLNMSEADKVYPNPDYMTLLLPFLYGEKLNKKAEGGREEFGKGDTIKANTRIKLVANCLISPSKNYHALFTVNPILHDVATTEYQQVMGMQRSAGNTLQVAPYVWCDFKKSFKLSNLDYLFELRCIE